MKYCPNCGTKLEERMKFCPECGQNITGSSVKKKQTYEEYLLEEIDKRRREDERHGLWRSNLLPKLIKTVSIVCRNLPDEVHSALVEYYEDSITGEVKRKVKCIGNCYDCPYGDVE